MRVLLTGATGFIGRALIPRLQRDGHAVVAWVRSPASARSQLGAEVELVPADTGFDGLVRAIERCDAVVNLAGEPLMGGRWTAARRAILEDSRVTVTDLLVRAIAAARTRPGVFISGSAVGYYGDRGEETLTETSASGDGFSRAALSPVGERGAPTPSAGPARRAAANRGRSGPGRWRAGARCCRRLNWGGRTRRIGQAIPAVDSSPRSREDHRGGAARRSLSGTGERRGARAGDQPIVRARPRSRPASPGDTSAAGAGTQGHLRRGGDRAAGEPAGRPSRAPGAQFAFDFPTLDAALEDIVGGTAIAISPALSRPEGAGEARYELRTRTVMDAPLAETFAFFSKAANLGLITPAAMKFSIQGQVPPMATGAMIDYRVRVGPLPVRWRTRITSWEPGRRFADLQEKGPYRLWWHEHTFHADGQRTVMEDRVYYTPPLGLLGRLANRLFIRATLRKIFQYRGDVIRLRFGVS